MGKKQAKKIEELEAKLLQAASYLEWIIIRDASDLERIVNGIYGGIFEDDECNEDETVVVGDHLDNPVSNDLWKITTTTNGPLVNPDKLKEWRFRVPTRNCGSHDR